MVTDRLLQEYDESLLKESLERDVYHTTTTPEFFTEEGTLTKVYELDSTPVLFARASKSLRLDLQFVDNNDARKNIKVMLEGFPEIIERARANGFREVIFNTSSELLEKFCRERLGFTKVDGQELRRAL